MRESPMKAVLLPGGGQVEVVDRADPEPGPGEVLVRVRASALCRSDMSLYDGTPIVGGDTAGSGAVIPGHESAGEVVALGPNNPSVAVGDRVAIYLAIGEGRCEWCRRGYRMLCPSWKCVGFDVDGGDAEYVVVPAENCLPVPDEMSFEVAALSTDMIGTQYSTQARLKVSGSDTVAVFGLGPMGAAGVLVAKARGARVIAVDVLKDRLDLAARLGADVVVDSASQDAVTVLRRATSGNGVDVAIDCSGNPKAQNAALDATRRLGFVAFVGESRSTTINPSDQMIRKMLTVIGGWYFATWEYAAISRFILDHDIPVDQLVTHRFPLADAPTAFRMFNARETEKAVFVLN
jgi:threonine dehydrogenase-like Zn-dependent dehydrogenase